MIFKQRLLLLAVEILDLVEIKQNSLRAEDVFGRGEHVLDVLKRRRGGVEAHEGHIRVFRNERSRGGLARAGRAEEDHIRDPARVAKAADNAVFAEKMGLTDYIVEGGGSDEFS